MTLWLPQEPIRTATIPETVILAGCWKGVLVYLKLETSYRTRPLGSWGREGEADQGSRDLGPQGFQSKRVQP